MKRGDKVQVKDLPSVEASFRGKIGTMVADSEVGDVVVAEFEGKGKEKATTHAFKAADIAQVANKARTPAHRAHASK